MSGQVSSAYDANFACCGGCSSSHRADAYNNKLANGARVFIWDIKLKTDPSPVCLGTFPYDRALNEQEGDRRVRSGRLVGTSYPIDHDFDTLCCQQRGLCQLQDEDASGKCQCVKKWGFTGDHCEYSVYDIAAQNNTKRFPASTSLTDATQFLPDLRPYLVAFDVQSGLRASRSVAVAASEDNLMSAFRISEDISYRQYAWSTCALVVLGAALLLLLFTVQLIWSYCCFKCGCRKKDPRKQPKVYSKATKICWAVVMVLFLAAGMGAAMVSFLTVQSQLLPSNDAVQALLGSQLPSDLSAFGSTFISPFYRVISADGAPNKVSLATLQLNALSSMIPLTFLDSQSTTEDVLSQPVFALLDGLQNYSALYPTVQSPSIDCARLNITPNIVLRMTIGATSGCFRCKTCSQLMALVDDARDRWRRGAYKAQLDLRESREQLLDFGSKSESLTPALTAFHDRLNSSTMMVLSRLDGVASQYNRLSSEARQLTVFGLFALMGLSGLALALALVASSVGVTTNKRPMTRTTCFVGEIACVVALVMVGVLYSTALMAHDGIVALLLLSEDMSVFVDNPVAAADTTRWLVDESIVDGTSMNKTLAFADTLRVPPHPTPTTDDPGLLDVKDLYDLPALFELESQMRDNATARVAMFGWEPSFLVAQYGWLHSWAFGNDSVISPYNQTLHQTLLKSTATALMDPDNDTLPATEDDYRYIQTVFSESWRAVDDRGVAQNELIASQWLLVARLELQQQHLDRYLAGVANVISSTKPLLQGLIFKTAELEAAEFALKAPVEFYTETLRTAKLHDCSFNANCAWFRSTVNSLFAEFQDLITQAEVAAIGCFGSFVALLLGLVCADCFASRLRRSVVKVYSAN